MNAMRIFFFYLLFSLKNSNTVEGKKFSPKKVTYISLASSHSIILWQIFKPLTRILWCKQELLSKLCFMMLVYVIASRCYG